MDRFLGRDYRQDCKYGANCYQKNPEHKAKFKHPESEPDKENKNVQQDNLKRNCNQRNLEERKKFLIDNVACLNEHLQIARKDLLQISCKINELQELNKRKEIEQCRNSTFVCCCLITYILCLLFFIFGVTWLYSNF